MCRTGFLEEIQIPPSLCSIFDEKNTKILYKIE
jgi:hypothetical protein